MYGKRRYNAINFGPKKICFQICKQCTIHQYQYLKSFFGRFMDVKKMLQCNKFWHRKKNVFKFVNNVLMYCTSVPISKFLSWIHGYLKDVTKAINFGPKNECFQICKQCTIHQYRY